MPVEDLLTRGFGSTLLLRMALGHNLFTGDVTVTRQTLKRSARRFIREKLTISTEKFEKSDNYNFA